MTLKRCKHIIHAGIGKVAAALLSLSVLAGCADNSGAAPDEPELPVVEEKEKYVNLDLRISVNNGTDPTSRAFTPDKYYPFEPTTASDYEKVHTLRVVIVRASGIIEHNRMVTVRDNYSNIIQSEDIINDNLRFKVVAGEEKKIYLFANESAVNWNKEENDKFDFTSQLMVGKTFPTEDVSNILIKRKPNEAFINNDGDGANAYIPMSEWFENIEIPAASGNVVEEDRFIPEYLFITRSLIKFSFSVTLTPGTDVSSTDMTLKGVKISNLANEGYYFPNGTEYSPKKGEESNKPLGGREITQFKVPIEFNATDDTNTPEDSEGSAYSDCTFMFIEPLQITEKGDETGPLIYLPESKILSENTNYMLTLLFTDDTQDEHFESKPLEIRDIPRNTHVKINITLKKFNLDATVTVLPYTGVWLNPTFGIDRD